MKTPQIIYNTFVATVTAALTLMILLPFVAFCVWFIKEIVFG